MFDDTLHFLANHLEAPDWRRLGEHLPVEWIEEAIERTDPTSIRHRRLPAEQVIWLMIALALYRHKSISEVLDDLGLALPDTQTPFVSKSAAAQARQRHSPKISAKKRWLLLETDVSTIDRTPQSKAHSHANRCQGPLSS